LLERHLKYKHPEIYEEMRKIEKEEKEASQVKKITSHEDQ
jgi:hypothetical protein